MRDHYNDPADRKKQEIYIAAEALLDELDKKQQYIKLRDQENEDIALTVGKLRVELEAAENRIAEVESQRRMAFMACNRWADKFREAEKRVAELEASHSNLREAMAGIHNTITAGGSYTPLAAILNSSKRAYEESAAAAGKGE
ncbi:ead/Ea22-like family protein [Salmonella enterica]|nr:ead/Ea22-like family protein [Salmonella enterica]